MTVYIILGSYSFFDKTILLNPTKGSNVNNLLEYLRSICIKSFETPSKSGGVRTCRIRFQDRSI